MTKIQKESARRILGGLATQRDLSELSRDDLIALKGDTSEMHTRFIPSRDIAVERRAGDDKSKPRFRHVASDESVDGMGDIIRVRGWDLDRFEKNPVLLWAHDQHGLPLGVVERIYKGRAGSSPALLSESRIHDGDMNPMGPAVERLIESGALPGVSVGFIPKEMRAPEDEAERKELGVGPFGVVHEKQELLELSVVPVPANGNALMRSMLPEGITVEALEARAAAAFASLTEEGFDRDMLEAVRAALCMTDAEQERIRRRYIVVPDLQSACAAVVRSIEPQAEPDVPEDTPAAPEPEATVQVAVPNEAIERIERAAQAISDAAQRIADTRTQERLTEHDAAAAGTAKAVDPPTGPVDAGGDFLVDAIEALKAGLST